MAKQIQDARNNGKTLPYGCDCARDKARTIHGVFFHTRSGRWRARANALGQTIELGTYKTKEEAIAARLAATDKYVLMDEREKSMTASYTQIIAKKHPGPSGYTGVQFRNGKWLARICFQKVEYHLGSFDSMEDAVAARKDAEKYLHNDFVEWYRQHRSKPSVNQ